LKRKRNNDEQNTKARVFGNYSRFGRRYSEPKENQTLQEKLGFQNASISPWRVRGIWRPLRGVRRENKYPFEENEGLLRFLAFP
jgi:hypothetical protein